MRVVVIGAGAIGSLVAGRLARAGDEVTVVARPARAAELRRSNGVQLTGLTEGTFPVHVVTDLPDGSADWIFLAVKAPDAAAAAASLPPRYPSPVPVLALQNGLGVEAHIMTALRTSGWPHPERSLLRGVTTYGAFVEPEGAVRHAGDGEILLPKDPAPVPDEDRDRIATGLRAAGFTVRLVADLPRELWRKALINAAINPVTADLGLLNGELVKDPYRGQAERLLREAQLAARLEGFDFTDAEIDQALWGAVRATAANRSSMRQDLERGRPTEIDAISGAILATARRHGLDLPATRRAIDRIHRKERGPAGRNDAATPSQP